MALPITAVFADLSGPRRPTANTRHAPTDILAIGVCATIGGAETWEQMAEYGRRSRPSGPARPPGGLFSP